MEGICDFMKTLKKNAIHFFKGFKYAYDGIVYTIKNERNMRIHILIMLLVIIFGIYFRFTKINWIICIILFGLVLSAECFNTAIEVLNNMIRMNEEEKYIAAGHSKDTAAGAVLILAISAAIIGFMLFIPHITKLF